MIVLGVICLIVAAILAAFRVAAATQPLIVVGIVLVVIGIILELVGARVY